jgi:hypothetical protein
MSFELSFKHYGEAGKDKLSTEIGFDFFRFERIEGDMMLLEGSLTKIITRGKNKGDVRWLPEGERKTVMTADETIVWCEKYEKETGNCAQCFGEGKVMNSWSAKDGTKYRPCNRCSGSGKSVKQIEA